MFQYILNNPYSSFIRTQDEYFGPLTVPFRVFQSRRHILQLRFVVPDMDGIVVSLGLKGILKVRGGSL